MYYTYPHSQASTPVLPGMEKEIMFAYDYTTNNEEEFYKVMAWIRRMNLPDGNTMSGITDDGEYYVWFQSPHPVEAKWLKPAKPSNSTEQKS